MLRLPVKIVTFVVAQEFEGKMEAFQSWSHLEWRRLQVVLFMNNQGVCLHFAHKWFLKMQPALYHHHNYHFFIAFVFEMFIGCLLETPSPNYLICLFFHIKYHTA